MARNKESEMSAKNGQHEESKAPQVPAGLARAAERFNAVLDRYGPPPASTEELLGVINKQIPRYSLYMVCAFGLVAGLLGLALGMITHSGPQTAWLFLFWGVVAILVTRQRRWAQSFVFGTTMFAARGLLPWESLWNGVKYYRLAFATLKESYRTIQEGEALKKTVEGASEGGTAKKGRKWKRGIRIEKKL
jgi:hypothetical protein